MSQITLGSDPEVMIKFNSRGGRIVSSIPIIKRDKYNPVVLPGDFKVYSDNVLMEFSHPPFYSSEAVRWSAIDKWEKPLYKFSRGFEGFLARMFGIRKKT